MTGEEYIAAQARNVKIGERCRDAWYLLGSLGWAAFVTEWWRVGAALLGISTVFYVAWGRCTKRSLQIMEEHFRSLANPPPRPPE